MRNNETLSGNTGSLPKGMQFLQHGTPSPMPGKSEAELERAEQTEFNLFTDDETEAPAAAPEPDTAPTPAVPERAPLGDMTASIASIIASVFEDAAASGQKTTAAAQQTGRAPVVLDTADASRPLPHIESADASRPLPHIDSADTPGPLPYAEPAAYAAYESGVLPDQTPYSPVQPEGGAAQGYAEPVYQPEQRYTEPGYYPADGYADPGYYPADGYADPGYDAGQRYPNRGYAPNETGQPSPQQATGAPSGGPAGRPAASKAGTAGRSSAKKANTGNTGKAGNTGKNGKAGTKKTKISRDAARIVKESKPIGGPAAPAPGTSYINIGDSGVRDTASFKTMLQDIRARQKDALSPETVSVGTALKNLQARTRLGRLLNPVRYFIILLMVLCLAGRKYSWMTLGFMDGYPGTKFAIFMTVVSMFVSWRAAKSSVRDIFFLKPGYETWLLIASILTASEAVLHDNARSLMPILAIAWCFAGIADYKNDQVQIQADKAMLKKKYKVGLRMKYVSTKTDIPIFTDQAADAKKGRFKIGKKSVSVQKNQSLIGKSKASVRGFVRHQEEPDAFHRLWTFACPVLFVVMLIFAAYVSGRSGKLYLTTLVLLMDMATPVGLAICCVRPYELFTAATRKYGVVAGWHGMQQLSGNRSMLLYDNDFYPTGTIKKKEIRLYSHVDLKTFVSYAACLGIRANIGYREMFIDMMREVNGDEVAITGLKVLKNGVQCRIHNRTYILGSYECMQLEGVGLPLQASHDSLFLALRVKNRQKPNQVNDQEQNPEQVQEEKKYLYRLLGEIVIDYRVKHGASAAFRHLQREPGLYTLVAARNFVINPRYIQRTFKTNTGKVICMKAEKRRSFAKSSILDNSTVCGYVFHDGIVSYGMVTAGARRTYRAGFWMSVLSLVSAVILMLRTALTLLGRYGTPTGIGLITLNLILLLVCELISRFSAGNTL